MKLQNRMVSIGDVVLLKSSNISNLLYRYENLYDIFIIQHFNDDNTVTLINITSEENHTHIIGNIIFDQWFRKATKKDLKIMFDTRSDSGIATAKVNEFYLYFSDDDIFNSNFIISSLVRCCHITKTIYNNHKIIMIEKPSFSGYIINVSTNKLRSFNKDALKIYHKKRGIYNYN